MTESNKGLVRGFISAWGRRDIDAACACISPTCNAGGADGMRQELNAFITAFPDLTVTLEDILAEGDRVATRVTMNGTHRGPLFGIPATGRTVVLKANHIFRCDGGKIVLRHGQMDRLEMMTQIGMKVVPA